MKMDPFLLDQLLDPADASLSRGSNAVVGWRCPVDSRHVWQASPNSRSRGAGCPVCANKLVLPGVNDLLSTHPDLAAELADPESGTSVSAGSHAVLRWRCGCDDRHLWEASVVSRVRLNSGCPFCSGRRPLSGIDDLGTTHPEVAALLSDLSQAAEVGAGSGRRLRWSCPQGHDWEAPVRSVVRHASCPRCRGIPARGRRSTVALERPDLLVEAVHPDQVGVLTVGSGRSVAWTCRECPTEHEYELPVRSRVAGRGCPLHAGKQVRAGINDLATTHPELAAELVDQDQAVKLSRGSAVAPEWRCDQGHRWNSPVYARVAGNGCPSCSGAGTSTGEQQVLDAVRAAVPGAEHRKVLKDEAGRVEVDVLAGDLVVEFNGLYWHSEAAGKGRTWHRDKVARLRSLKLRPFTVWEDDWADPVRRVLVVRALAHRLGEGASLPAMLAAVQAPGPDPAWMQRRGARELRAAELSGPAAAEFFVANHLQGAVALTRTFALCDEQGRVWAALGLRSPGHSARSARAAGEWEVQRYATAGLVPGGLSKLLRVAERCLLADGERVLSWVSLSADESSDGAMYAAAGFSRAGSAAPSYWYTGGPVRGRRAPKEGFQLKTFRSRTSLFYEEGMTEREAATANGMVRIFDAGKTRWQRCTGVS